MYVKKRPEKKSKGEAIKSLIRAKIFFKPSQGTAGLRVKGRPDWDPMAADLLKTFWDDFSVKGIANFCIGERGRAFYECLKKKAKERLDYAKGNGKGFWYGIDELILHGKADEAENWVYKRFTNKHYPDTAVQNGYRIARYIAFNTPRKGETQDEFVRRMVEQALYINPAMKRDSIPKNAKNKDKLEQLREKVVAEFVDKAAEAAHQFATEMVDNLIIPPEVAEAFKKVAEVDITTLKTAIREALKKAGV